MNTRAPQGVLARMAGLRGMRSCAVVDAETGMVWHEAGEPEGLAIAEAASDYWRLCERQRVFASLGLARAQVAIHERLRLTIVACGRGLLLVAVSDEPDRVEWPRWKAAAGELQRALAPD